MNGRPSAPEIHESVQMYRSEYSLRAAWPLARNPEPGVLLAGVPRHQIEQDVHAAAVRLVEQGDQVVVGAVAWGDGAVVAHVVAGVLER